MSAASHGSDGEKSASGWRCGVIRGLNGATGRPGTRDLPPLDSPLLVLKVGGSLLSRPGWPALLMPLVAACRPGPCCVVVGGGAVVNGLRELDRAMPQSQQLMHDLAIDAMRLTARLVAAAVGLPLAVAPPDHVSVTVLDAPTWLAAGSRAASLPVGWQVTSDSIAALVAVEHSGSLLLAKSAPPPPCPDGVDHLSALARAGWVDEHFPIAAASLATIEWAAPQATA